MLGEVVGALAIIVASFISAYGGYVVAKRAEKASHPQTINDRIDVFAEAFRGGVSGLNDVITQLRRDNETQRLRIDVVEGYVRALWAWSRDLKITDEERAKQPRWPEELGHA